MPDNLGSIFLEHAAGWGRALPLERLLDDAQQHARRGYAVTASQEALTRAKLEH